MTADEFAAAAIALLRSAVGWQRAISRRLGVDSRTVRRWIKDGHTPDWVDKKLAEMMGAGPETLLCEIDWIDDVPAGQITQLLEAVAAYSDGLVPASKVPGVPAVLVKTHCRPTEWHHSSKNHNCVNFYNPAEVRAIFGLEAHEDYEADPSAVAALAAHKASAKKAAELLE